MNRLSAISSRFNDALIANSYPILRVFASWPGDAGIERSLGYDDSKSEIDTNRHPLASLHIENFENISKELARSWFRGYAEQLVVFAQGQNNDVGQV